MRCDLCFKMQITARPTINTRSSFQAQRVINSCGSGALSTQLYVEGHNQKWYRLKKLCIDHMCLLGDGNELHKKTMKDIRKEEATARCGKRIIFFIHID